MRRVKYRTLFCYVFRLVCLFFVFVIAVWKVVSFITDPGLWVERAATSDKLRLAGEKSWNVLVNSVFRCFKRFI